MKIKSVKSKITLLLTMLMATLAVLLLVFMLFISKSVAIKTTEDRLVATLSANLSHIEATEKKPVIDTEFSYYHNGISTLVYSQKESLIAGQIPVSFHAEVPFEHKMIRTVDSEDTKYLVLDFWLSSDSENGLWLRGLAEAPDTKAISQNLLIIALIALPLFILMATSGSYHIARRAFRPLEQLTAAAEAINDANDLSGRIALTYENAEFSRLAEDFNQMFERLERSFEAEKQFTADASHELRTPISVIKGACEYSLKYDSSPEEYNESISMIQRQADKMSVLISQLLQMTRMDQGTEKFLKKRINLGEFVNTLCQEQAWNLKQFSLTYESEIFVSANPELLSRLMINLVENAFKYSDPNDPVWVTVNAVNEEALISVKDKGIGISPEDQSKIWQRFYQADSSRSIDEGSGLGLSMVQQIAKIHDGYMSLESSVGTGSTFTLHLPICEK